MEEEEEAYIKHVRRGLQQPKDQRVGLQQTGHTALPVAKTEEERGEVAVHAEGLYASAASPARTVGLLELRRLQLLRLQRQQIHQLAVELLRILLPLVQPLAHGAHQFL